MGDLYIDMDIARIRRDEMEHCYEPTVEDKAEAQGFNAPRGSVTREMVNAGMLAACEQTRAGVTAVILAALGAQEVPASIENAAYRAVCNELEEKTKALREAERQIANQSESLRLVNKRWSETRKSLEEADKRNGSLSLELTKAQSRAALAESKLSKVGAALNDPANRPWGPRAPLTY